MSRLYFRLNLTREFTPLESFSDRFHGIGLDAHIYATFGTSISLFLSRLNKPFFVDPVFYRFSFPYYRNFSEKRWAENLMESYRITQLLEENSNGLLPNNISKQDLKSITRNVLDFQRNCLPSSSIETRSLLGLIDESESTSVKVSGPEFLIPPYLIYEGSPDILDANLSFLEASLELVTQEEKIYAPIILDPDSLLDDGLLEQLISAYSQRKSDGYTIWITDLKEFEADSVTLKYYARFLRKLKAASPSAEIIDLYGGYYSVILASNQLLDGVVQGIGISESKNPAMIGGGGRSRYYVPIAKQMVSVDSAADLVSVNRKVFFCNCGGCVLNSDILHKSIKELDEHFIENRVNEFQHLELMNTDQIVTELKESAGKLRRITDPTASAFANRFSNRLSVWARTLSES